MKKVLFITGYPAPYRVRFFDQLGLDTDLTVVFSDRKEDQTHRSQSWFVESQGHFHAVQLEKGRFRTRGGYLRPDVLPWLKKSWDIIVVCGYASPTIMLAMAWLRLRGIPFYMEVDGGLIRQDSPLSYRLKRMLVSQARGWLSTSRATTDYLVHYGADPGRVWQYPFTTLSASDIPDRVPTRQEKLALRRELGLTGENILLSIGQFIPRKGFDILLKAAALLDRGTEIYIVGGEPTEEYRLMARQLGLENVHFVGFLKKEVLARYYQAADLFVLPTREDIWGLVINEAMAYGLPVVTTDRCVAGLELVEDGVNGYIVPVEDENALAQGIQRVLNGDRQSMMEASLEKVQPYTIENMAKAHVEIFTRQTGECQNG